MLRNYQRRIFNEKAFLVFVSIELWILTEIVSNV